MKVTVVFTDGPAAGLRLDLSHWPAVVDMASGRYHPVEGRPGRGATTWGYEWTPTGARRCDTSQATRTGERGRAHGHADETLGALTRG